MQEMREQYNIVNDEAGRPNTKPRLFSLVHPAKVIVIFPGATPPIP